MAEVVKSVLVEYTPEQMFELIDAVERYPEFLPWCGGASVAHRDERTTLATININYHGVRQSFTTENLKESGRLMQMKLIEGPFSTLDGVWQFVALSQSGCKIEFRLHYEFSSRLLERLVGRVFNHIANTLVEAFVRRAQAVYGTR